MELKGNCSIVVLKLRPWTEEVKWAHN